LCDWQSFEGLAPAGRLDVNAKVAERAAGGGESMMEEEKVVGIGKSGGSVGL